MQALSSFFSNGTKNKYRSSKQGSKRLRNGDCQKPNVERKISTTIKEESHSLLTNQTLNHSSQIKDCCEDKSDATIPSLKSNTCRKISNKNINSTLKDTTQNEHLSVIF